MSIPPHVPKQPFIRVVETKTEEGRSYKWYCTLCRKQVRTVFDTKTHLSKWEHIDAVSRRI